MLFMQHRQLTEMPNVRLPDLYETEQRLSAHLDFGMYCGAQALDMARSIFEESPTRGEVSMFAHVAMLQGNKGFPELIGDMAADPQDAVAAIGHAFAFCGKPVRRDYLGQWIHSDNPFLVQSALEAAIQHRLNLRELLIPLFDHPDSGIRARAYEYAGVMGLAEHGPRAEEAAGDSAPDVAFAAAVAGCRIASGATIVPLLSKIGPSSSARDSRLATEVAFLTLNEENARDHVRTLLSDIDTRRWGLLALGVIGAARTLDFIISDMAAPEFSRMAGWAFSMITGANVAEDDLELDEFPDSPDNPLLEDAPEEDAIEEALPWPDPERVKAWMSENGSRLSSDHSMLFGLARWSYQDIDTTQLEFQGRFRAVAQAIAMQSPDRRLPNWRSRVFLQDRQFQRDWQMG